MDKNDIIYIPVGSINILEFASKIDFSDNTIQFKDVKNGRFTSYTMSGGINNLVKMCLMYTEINNMLATNNLASLYLNGLGIKKDIILGKQLFNKSYQCGYLPALKHINNLTKPSCFEKFKDTSNKIKNSLSSVSFSSKCLFSIT
jgi:hypothetical protein